MLLGAALHTGMRCCRHFGAAAALLPSHNQHCARSGSNRSNMNYSSINKSYSTDDTSGFQLRKALIVAKLSRFEFEQIRYPDLNPVQLEKKIRDRGTDYDSLVVYNDLHVQFRKQVVECFQRNNVEVKVVDRLSINREAIDWADIIVPVGGDGTFLLAASRAGSIYANGNNRKPVVGFNSDPAGSEGRLMLPKQYSSEIDTAIKRIKNRDFKWMHRSRIRVTLLSANGKLPAAMDLHEHKGGTMEHLCLEADQLSQHEQQIYKARVKRVIPYLALNEVFIGETLAARVSFLRLKVDDYKETSTKCSGLCISTGTGSTSWHTSINRLSHKNVEELMYILRRHNVPVDNVDVAQIADEFNQRLVFLPDDPRLCYSIREEIRCGVWPNPKGLESRQFVNKLFVQSKCLDASLVIDGSISYPFNDGAKVLLETKPEDALVTMLL